MPTVTQCKLNWFASILSRRRALELSYVQLSAVHLSLIAYIQCLEISLRLKKEKN